MSQQGLRYTEGKIRHDLLEPYAINELARVFTEGAKKYDTNNWLKGMDWTKCLASLKRHINKWEQGEDFDDETGCFHMAHAAWNALALVSYTKFAPQYDDRFVHTVKKKRIALDVDEVLCNFVDEWCNKFNLDTPDSWYFDSKILERFNAMRNNGTLDDFYINLTPLVEPNDIPFEPHCYVTSRPVDTHVTEKWLKLHGFPARPVITVPMGESKVDALKKAGVDVMVDDRYENFKEINHAGILCFLFDAKHNQRYDVGFKRIKSLNELKHL